MNITQVDYLNILLMSASFFVALILPFELFLFSYAILGPLHYLTEISWLHKRNYFSDKRKDSLVLIGLCFLVVLGITLEHGLNPETKKMWLENSQLFSSTLIFLRKWNPSFIFISFMMALAMLLFKTYLKRIGFLVAAICLAGFLLNVKPYLIFFGVFLPTIIHVYFFTGSFILLGALKSRSLSGFISLFVFTLCGVGYFLIQYYPEGYSVGKYVRDSFIESKFHYLNAHIFSLIKGDAEGPFVVFGSVVGINIQQFIAWAYTYHYLNWFSKTKVINWHEVPRNWLWLCGLIWGLSVTLYIVDYKAGFIALTLLSMLHVFLEFPLNFRTFSGIAQSLRINKGG